MDLKISNAGKEDVHTLKQISKRCFEKFDLQKFGFKFCDEQVEKNLDNWINQENFIFRVCKIEGKIVGFGTAFEMENLYSNEQQLILFKLHSDPILKKFFQAKIIFKLIQYFEKLGNAKHFVINLSDDTNIGKYLLRKDYKVSDIIYIKRRDL